MYRIFVPLDRSARAERSIPWADELARALDAAAVATPMCLIYSGQPQEGSSSPRIAAAGSR